MVVQIYPEHDTLSLHLAGTIVAEISNNPTTVLCLATGDTPRLAYRLMADSIRKEGVDCSQCIFVGLDEWVGIPPEDDGSCAFFLRSNVFDPLGIRADQIKLFDATASDVKSECDSMASFIREKGGIDLMVVGIGMNGHIGFNEPGATESSRVRVVDLDLTTQEVGQKYFKKATMLSRGFTWGIQDMLESRRIILAASGETKADIVRETLQGSIGPEVPASFVRKHKNALIMLDEGAASSLTLV